MREPAELDFPDSQTLDDLATFVGRAKAADPDGAVRFQAQGTTLAVSVGVLPGWGLLGEGGVIGLRAVRLAAEADLDLTVSLASVTDRLARPAGPGGPSLSVPPVRVSAPWAAVAPPRGGWERVGAVRADALEEVARQGIAEVASQVPAQAGGQAITSLRRQVWGRSTHTTPPVPAGGAFAAYVLGFAQPGTELTVWAHGRWTRLSSAVGHVLIR